MLHRNGTFRWVLCRGAAVRNADGRATRLAGSLTDITDAKVADALTGLPNRLLFVDLLDRAIERAHRRPGLRLRARRSRPRSLQGRRQQSGSDDGRPPAGRGRAAAPVGLRVADGARPAGDTMSRWRGCRATSSRCCSTTSPTRPTRCASPSGCAVALDKPFDLDGHQVFASAAAGIAVSTERYERAEEVLRDAATALHRAKVDRTARCELFDPAMRDRAVARLQVETDLRQRRRRARVRGRTTSRSSRLRPAASAAFEALVRWRHPVRGLVPPDRVHRASPRTPA